MSIRGDVHVIPGDVHHLLGRLLDLDLFDVSALQRMGYGDARASSLPLIVQRRMASRPPALAGVTRVWLDRRFRATDLDPNLTQIGAPAAWSAGLTGEGVKVAVLDTGACSCGDRKGVAFEASLLNGKVLDDFGFGSESGIIAGMEWAARQRARVVNMSLGGWPTDGTDPMSQAVTRLTYQYRTLFVVAAGNSGPGDQTVENPGVATDALTVGAVDAEDNLADFSGRGPRHGDYAMEPDITAPGVDIVAARAAGTPLGEPVGQWYTRATGTSMATPHVAGAAAIMAQRWPSWTPARIKAVLMGTANPHPDLSVDAEDSRVQQTLIRAFPVR